MARKRMKSVVLNACALLQMYVCIFYMFLSVGKYGRTSVFKRVVIFVCMDL